MSRIQATFYNENVSSTFVDSVNDMPEEFILDMPGRISVMKSWVQL